MSAEFWAIVVSATLIIVIVDAARKDLLQRLDAILTELQENRRR